MDKKLTEKIQEYLNAPVSERDVVAGATMLLSLNRNRILFQNVLRSPDKFANKVAYELKKHLAIRLDNQTIADVIQMNKEVLPMAQQIVDAGAPVVSTDDDNVPQNGKIARGRRADHDQLPDEIKALWEECALLWFKIKETFEQLKGMEDAPACDRYEYLRVLDEADKKYRANMQVYDGYVLGAAVNDAPDVEPVDDPAVITKKVNAARKYLSDNKKKLADLRISKSDKYDVLLSKVQERYDYLISTGNTIDEAQMVELSSLGIKVG